jgi:pyruvate/2-oxoglutarate dehydrogenase complex dihydrolipoamide dehydrogenase (E3) component
VADGHREWAAMHQIVSNVFLSLELEMLKQKKIQNVSLSTSLESGTWNDESSTWTLRIQCEGKEEFLEAKHLIFATGAGSRVPYMPQLENRVLQSKPLDEQFC